MPNTKAELKRLLQERSLYPERAAQIDAEIYAAFGVNLAVLVMDMTGFSRTTLRYGLVHFLTMIHRMNEIAPPAVERNGGVLVKFVADNLFAAFPQVDQAILAARELIYSLSAANVVLPDEMDMHGKFGIGYGEILLIENEDFYGAEVNLAAKLGENIAHADEILLTQAAWAQVSAYKQELQPAMAHISGLELHYFRLGKAV